MAKRVKAWLGGDESVQHLAAPPEGDTTREWDGVAVCGAEGQLRWVTPENVDSGLLCESCVAVDGYSPALEGDHPGPV